LKSHTPAQATQHTHATQAHNHVYMCTHIWAHRNAHVTQAHTSTHKHTQAHTSTYKHIQAHTSTYKHIQAHTDTHRHPQTHTGSEVFEDVFVLFLDGF